MTRVFAVAGGVSFLRLHVRAYRELLPAYGYRGIFLVSVVHQCHLFLHQGEGGSERAEAAHFLFVLFWYSSV